MTQPPLFADLAMPVRDAWDGERVVRVKAWQLWPPRKSLDGQTWLCRWCAQPLSGNRHSYCSDACMKELWTRASLPQIRSFVFERDKGVCARCGRNVAHLEQALKWFEAKRREIEKRDPLAWRHVKDWPGVGMLKLVLGFRTPHLWEVNHVIAIADGGDPVDPANLELACMPCHREHTADLAKRRAKTKRIQKKFGRQADV